MARILAAAQAALAEAPNDVVGHRIAGHACFWLGYDAEGLTHFEPVLQSEPNLAPVWHMTSVMLYRSGNAVSAYQRALRACQLAPGNVEYAHQRRVAATAAVPSWHFNMLNDTARNAAFAAAIAACIRPEQLVLEIGTGSGLLAMLAARAGAAHVVTCEANPLLAQVATELVAQNGFADSVRVIAKPSTELALGTDLPQRADILLCEIFSVQVITEGVLPSLEDAKARLLKPGAIVVPSRAAARGVLVASDTLARTVRVGEVHGLDLSALNEFQPVLQYLPLGHELELLSAPVDLLAFDLVGAQQFPGEKRVLEVPVIASGVCQGVLQWLYLELTPGLTFENDPRNAAPGSSQHWAPVFYPFPEPVALEVGQRVSLRVSHNRVGMRVEFAGVSPVDF